MLLTVSLVFAITLVIGVPVAFSLGLSGAVYIIFWERIDPTLLSRRMFYALDNFALLAIPLFIMIGFLAERAGILDKLVAWLQILVGRMKGGIAYINVLASMLFAGISGTAVSDVASMGRVEIEMMRRSGYDMPFSAALTAASSIVGPIIPPSVAMIIFALAAGNVSIGGLFLAGAVPGVMLGLGFLVICYFKTRKGSYAWYGQKVTVGDVIRTTVGIIPLLVLPVIIIGGILSGIFTVTESAAIGVIYVLIIGFGITRQLSLRDVYDAIINAAEMTAVVAVLIGAGAIVSWILTRNQAVAQLSEWLVSLTADPIVFMVLLMVVLGLLGCVMDSVALVVALTPVFFPIALQYGVPPLQFGLVFVLTTLIGMLTPPVGIILFLVSTISGVSVERISLEVIPFVIWCFVVVVLAIFIPEISLWLPRMFGFA